MFTTKLRLILTGYSDVVRIVTKSRKTTKVGLPPSWKSTTYQEKKRTFDAFLSIDFQSKHRLQ